MRFIAATSFGMIMTIGLKDMVLLGKDVSNLWQTAAMLVCDIVLSVYAYKHLKWKS